jgi:hypothetical protein
MRKFVLPAAAAAALAFVAADAGTAKAQIVIGSGYPAPGYYGGYSPYSGGALPIGQGGLIQAVEGQVLNSTGLGYNAYPSYTSRYGAFGSSTYPSYTSGYSTFGNYAPSGYQSYYGSGYRTYGVYAPQSYYGGGRGYRGRR